MQFQIIFNETAQVTWNEQAWLEGFYCAHIRSVLSYASPVFYTQLSDSVKPKLERIQKTATEIVCPHVTRLSILDLCTLDSFIHTQMEKHFLKISCDEHHPLFSNIIFNNEKRSSHLNTKYRPPRCRTQKKSNSFFPYYMRHFNNFS